MTNEERDIMLTRIDTTVLRIEKEYVSKHAFYPVRIISYGLAGSIGLTVVGIAIAQAFAA